MTKYEIKEGNLYRDNKPILCPFAGRTSSLNLLTSCGDWCGLFEITSEIRTRYAVNKGESDQTYSTNTVRISCGGNPVKYSI